MQTRSQKKSSLFVDECWRPTHESVKDGQLACSRFQSYWLEVGAQTEQRTFWMSACEGLSMISRCNQAGVGANCGYSAAYGTWRQLPVFGIPQQIEVTQRAFWQLRGSMRGVISTQQLSNLIPDSRLVD